MADIDKRRGKWVARWREPSGRQRSQAFDSYRDAQKHLTKVQGAIDEGRYIPAEAGKITVREYSEDWLTARTSGESSQETWERMLRCHVYPKLGEVPLAQLTPSRVQAWIKGLGVSPQYTRNLTGLLAGILNAAVDDERIARNPFHARSVKPPKAPPRELVPWAAERVALIRGGLPDRYAAMADCGAGLGMRQGEVLALSPGDIDWMRRVVHVRRQLKIVGRTLVFDLPKGAKARDVPLPGSVSLRLSAHIAAFPPIPVTLPWKGPGGRPETADLMFTTPRRAACWRGRWNQSAWHPALRAAGITPCRDAGFHQLRHRFASALLAEGVDVNALATYLGHDDPGFTLRVYCHLMPDTADKMRAAIDAALTPGRTGRTSGRTLPARH